MATIYVSPLGSGSGSGASAANAMAFSNLNTAIQAAGPGGTVLLLADKGDYRTSGTVTITAGGSDAAPVTLKGVDSAGNPKDIQIYGDRPPFSASMSDPGNVLFKLLDGANNLVFNGFDFHNVQMAFRLGGNLRNVTIENMEAENLNYFVGNFASGTNTAPSVTGLTVRDVEVHGFSKAVVLLQYNTNKVVLDNLYGDSEYNDGDIITMGVHFTGTVHDVLVQDSTMLNCIAAGSSTSYWNGDGFCTEDDVYGVRFVNCYAAGNGDSGYDIKSASTVLENCVSEDNGRNFRFWSSVELINPVGIDPHQRGGSASQLQIWVGNGADVKVTGGQFVDSGSKTRVAVTEGTGSTISFSNTAFTHSLDGMLTVGPGITGITSALVRKVASTGLFSTNGSSYLTQSSVINGTDAADQLTTAATGDWTVNGLGGNDTIATGGGRDTVAGGAGDDSINAGAGDDVIRVTGTAHGFDVVDGGAGVDSIVATQSSTNIGLKSVTGIEQVSSGGFSSVWIVGSGGNDLLDFSATTLSGIRGIKAGSGNDTVYGSTGDDVISGGTGADIVCGGAGRDTFKFASSSETTTSASDRVLDFQSGVDRIDLSAIDAASGVSGNQAFTFIGSSAFSSKVGQLRVDYTDPMQAKVLGDVNGDGVADFAILLGTAKLVATDFIL